MARCVVRGFWGPRPEPVEELARRWSPFLDRVAGLLPGAARPGWRVVTATGPPEATIRDATISGDEPGLRDVLRAVRAADAWADRTGTGLRLVWEPGPAGWEVEVSGVAGGTPEYLLQSVVLVVTAPAGATVADAELLTALVAHWRPDHGEVTDDDVMDALEDDVGLPADAPSVGWLAHLSPGRAALVPADLRAGAEQTPDGGVLLRLAGVDDVPAVVAACTRLRAAGALEPLPRPLDRAVL